MVTNRKTVAKRVQQAAWMLESLILFFGLLTLDVRQLRFTIAGLFIFSLPLFIHAIRKSWTTFGVTWRMCWVAPAVLSPWVLARERNFTTLRTHTDTIVTFQGIPGVDGPQHVTTDDVGFRVTKKIDYKNKHGYRIF